MSKLFVTAFLLLEAVQLPSGDTVILSEQTSYFGIPVWLLIVLAIVALMSLLYVYFKMVKKPKHHINVPDDWRQPGYKIQFGEVARGVSGDSRKLYKTLIEKCHPDRFVGNEDKVEKATQISADITKNRHNYSDLIIIKNKAIEELGISFD